jgi:hypothetical protein
MYLTCLRAGVSSPRSCRAITDREPRPFEVISLFISNVSLLLVRRSFQQILLPNVPWLLEYMSCPDPNTVAPYTDIQLLIASCTYVSAPTGRKPLQPGGVVAGGVLISSLQARQVRCVIIVVSSHSPSSLSSYLL